MSRIHQVVLTLLTIICMVVIFLFSAEPADESSEKSLGIGYAIADIFIADFEQWEPQQQLEFVEGIEYPIRKGGHATEYAVLGFLLLATLYSWGDSVVKKRGLRILSAFIIAVLYAISDEIHQLFVPGRSCQLTDVMIDSVGAVFGILAFLLAGRLWNRLFSRRKKCDTLKADVKQKK